MSVPMKMWLWLCAIVIAGAAAWYHGYHTADMAWQILDDERKLSESQAANKAWADRFTLQAQLATRDQQLAASQGEVAQKRTEIVIKKEIVYRDKIKDVAVRDCVANSGLLDVYDTTLGLSNPAE